MSSNVMTASTKQEFPDMFELSTQFSDSAINTSELFSATTLSDDSINKERDKQSALGERKEDSDENNGNEGLGSEWISIGDKEDSNFFAGLENARLVLKREKEEKIKVAIKEKQEGDETKTDKVLPRLRRCTLDTVPLYSNESVTQKGFNKSGGEHIHQESTRQRRSLSPKRSPSGRITSMAVNRTRVSCSTKRSTLRRTTSCDGSTRDRSDLSGLTSLNSPALKKGSAGSVVSAQSTGSSRRRPPGRSLSYSTRGSVVSAQSTGSSRRRPPGRSLSYSTRVSRAERIARSLSPGRRIASSRRIGSNANGEPEIAILMDDKLEKDTKKKPVKPITSSSKRASSSKAKISSSPSLSHKTDRSARSLSPGRRIASSRRIGSNAKIDPKIPTSFGADDDQLGNDTKKKPVRSIPSSSNKASSENAKRSSSSSLLQKPRDGDGDQRERSLSPGRIASSRSIGAKAHSDPDISTLSDNQEEGKDTIKTPVGSISPSSDRASSENAKRSSSPSLLQTPHDDDQRERSLSPQRVGGKANSDPDISTFSDNVEDALGKDIKKKPVRSISPSSNRASSDDAMDKRSSSPSLLHKPRVAGRTKISAERRKNPGGRTHSPSNKRSSSPSLLAKPHMTRRSRSRSSEIMQKSSSPKRVSSPGDSPMRMPSSPIAQKLERSASLRAVEKKEIVSCPSSVENDNEDNESAEEKRYETVEKEEREERIVIDKIDDIEQKEEEAGNDIDKKDDMDNKEPDECKDKGVDEVLNSDTIADQAAKDNSEKEGRHQGKGPSSSDGDAGDEGASKSSSSSTSGLDKSKKRVHQKSRESTRAPTRGVTRSRSLPKFSAREVSRSPSRLGRSDRTQTHKEDTIKPQRERSRTREKSPTGEMRRPKEASRSPSRGLARSGASTRDISRPSGLAKAHSIKLRSHHDKRASSPTRRTPQRATSEKASRERRRGASARTSCSHSPVRDASSRSRMRDASSRSPMMDASSPSPTRGASHRSPSRRLRDGGGRHSRMKDRHVTSPTSGALGRNTTRGRLESKSSRRLRKVSSADHTNAAKQGGGPPMARNLSGPVPHARTQGNIQQRQLLGGLEATDDQSDDDESYEKELDNTNEENGDMFAASTWDNSSWHNSSFSSFPNLSAVTNLPVSAVTNLSAVTSAFAGVLGLGSSTHGSNPNTAEDKTKSRKFRTSIFGGKGKNKHIQGPLMQSLGDGDDSDSSSCDEFA